MRFMTTHGHIPSDDLKATIATGGLSVEALQAITHVPAEKMTRFLAEEWSNSPGASAPLPTDEEFRRISMLSAFLSTGLRIDDNERLRGILESLTVECHLTLDNIARLVDVDVNHVERALVDPSSVPLDARYRLAMRTSYIITAVNQVRPR